MLIKLNEDSFKAAFEIMDESFPEDEYRPFEGQRALLDIDEYRIYGYYREDSLAAFIAVWEFEELAYIEHFAVSRSFRNQGIGEAMLNELIGLIKKPFVLEVEPPESELTERRIGFYERNGFNYNDYPYIQPAIWEGRRSIALKIMSYPQELTKAAFENARNEIYRKVYGVIL